MKNGYHPILDLDAVRGEMGLAIKALAALEEALWLGESDTEVYASALSLARWTLDSLYVEMDALIAQIFADLRTTS